MEAYEDSQVLKKLKKLKYEGSLRERHLFTGEIDIDFQNCTVEECKKPRWNMENLYQIFFSP